MARNCPKRFKMAEHSPKCSENVQNDSKLFKMTQKLYKDIDFLTAMSDKYETGHESKDGGKLGGLEFKTAALGKKVDVELVGVDMVRDWHKLDRIDKVSLASMSVSSAGKEGEILAACPQISTLNLRDNLFGGAEGWKTVADIGQQLVELRSLERRRRVERDPLCCQHLPRNVLPFKRGVA